SYAARIDNRYGGRHLVPIAGEVEFVLVDFLARQGSIRIEHRHLTDVSLFVVLIDFFAGQGSACNREVLILDLVALDVVGDDFNELVLSLSLGTVGGQELGNFSSHTANRAGQTVTGPVAFNRWTYGWGTSGFGRQG